MTDGSGRQTSGLTRRRLLTAGAAASVVATAGCLGTRDGDVPEPLVTDDRIDDGWRLVDESDGVVFEEPVGPVTIRALERTTVYEYVDLAEAVAEAFDADGSPVIFFASRIDLRPALDGLPGGIGRDRLMEEVRPAAEAAFRDQLAASGLEDVERVDTDTVDVAGGHAATAYRFTAAFPIEGETTLPDGSTGPIDDVVEVEARLAVWHDGTDVMLSGGAYPTEPIIAVFDRALPDVLDAADVIGEVVDGDEAEALSTEPETFAEAVDALLVSVE
ncbi:hypothetical protein [Halorubrum sp. DTA98]|uniref:hypothetical protein n=1 Tax=Halorubrum sp. DTA98 TaxID=3402163 RepID=UPI003AAD4CF7